MTDSITEQLVAHMLRTYFHHGYRLAAVSALLIKAQQAVQHDE